MEKVYCIDFRLSILYRYILDRKEPVGAKVMWEAVAELPWEEALPLQKQQDFKALIPVAVPFDGKFYTLSGNLESIKFETRGLATLRVEGVYTVKQEGNSI